MWAIGTHNKGENKLGLHMRGEKIAGNRRKLKWVPPAGTEDASIITRKRSCIENCYFLTS